MDRLGREIESGAYSAKQINYLFYKYYYTKVNSNLSFFYQPYFLSPKIDRNALCLYTYTDLYPYGSMAKENPQDDLLPEFEAVLKSVEFLDLDKRKINKLADEELRRVTDAKSIKQL
jgi:hypothetical protein